MAPKKPVCPIAKHRKYPEGKLIKKGKRLKCHGCKKGKTYLGTCEGCKGTGYIIV